MLYTVYQPHDGPGVGSTPFMPSGSLVIGLRPAIRSGRFSSFRLRFSGGWRRLRTTSCSHSEGPCAESTVTPSLHPSHFGDPKRHHTSRISQRYLFLSLCFTLTTPGTLGLLLLHHRQSQRRYLRPSFITCIRQSRLAPHDETQAVVRGERLQHWNSPPRTGEEAHDGAQDEAGMTSCTETTMG